MGVTPGILSEVRLGAGLCDGTRTKPIGRFAVVTPTYAPDYETCVDLHHSILKYTPESTVHYLIISRRERELFAHLQGSRCAVLTYRDVFPRWFIETAWLNAMVRPLLGASSAHIVATNLHQLLPPIRGWIVQQLAKIAVASLIDCDLMVLADSDVQLVRPLNAEMLLLDGQAPLYRRGEVDARLPRHVTWNKVARQLLGLPDAQPPFPDYVSCFGVWDRRIVLALQERIQMVTGRHWLDAASAKLHFSEWTLYGLFLEQVASVSYKAPTTDCSRCHSYWETTPLDLDTAQAFVRGLGPDDVAVMINAKSYTPIGVRRAAFSALACGSPREP